MNLRKLPVQGAFIVEPSPHIDERGYFMRTWCREEFEKLGLHPALSQCSVAFNHREGTLRGLHYQLAPNEEVKLVRCIRGAIYDVVLDIRPDSPTFLQHAGFVLNSENRLMMYVPKGCAHGYQTLTDQAEVEYYISAAYAPELARGVRWNDPVHNIRWPLPVTVISERDRNFPDFQVTPSLKQAHP